MESKKIVNDWEIRQSKQFRGQWICEHTKYLYVSHPFKTASDAESYAKTKTLTEQPQILKI